MSSLKFDNVYIKNSFSIAGPLEKNGQIKKFDLTMDDYYYREKTFEQAEIKMQRIVIDNLLLQNKLLDGDIDYLIGGELYNQIAISSYSAKYYQIPFLGLYSACATFVESVSVGANLINSKQANNIIAVTSSHNLNSEKQFRFPVEYGAPKPHTATFTATGCVGALLTNEKSKIRVDSATIGIPIDMGMKDANNMGAVMAPAAAETLARHLLDLKRSSDYYDLILTGDLGEIGTKIFREYIKRSYDLKLKKHIDAGSELYLDNQETYAGASGPVALPLVLFNRILKTNKYKKILIIGTGSLHTVSLINQKNTIPAIAHAVSLEVI
ncbi:MAG: stage V sporulation protein AD [Bacilli bacterium]|nr:stage V sporulation protein AD [Bacilli bacterium]